MALLFMLQELRLQFCHRPVNAQSEGKEAAGCLSDRKLMSIALYRHSEYGKTRLADGTVVQDDLYITADFVKSKPVDSAYHSSDKIPKQLLI